VCSSKDASFLNPYTKAGTCMDGCAVRFGLSAK
jgi:hypothetical protein